MPETAPRVVPHLVEALAKSTEDRRNAIDALFWFGGDAAPAVPALRDVLSNGQWFERRRAARTLGAIGTDARSCVPELRVQLRDEHEAVREAARAALISLGEAYGLPPSAVESWPERTSQPKPGRPRRTGSTLTPRTRTSATCSTRTWQRNACSKAGRAEIVSLLGPPHTNDRWCLLYHLKSSIGSWAGGGPIENEKRRHVVAGDPPRSAAPSRAVYVYPE